MKEAVKRLIGQDNWRRLSGLFKQTKCAVFYLKPRNKRVVLDNDWLMETYAIPKRHTFFGYYDIAQIDNNGKRILAHSIAMNADSQKDKAKIGYFEIGNEKFQEITETSAWCWQQGARLRWHPASGDSVVFNNAYNHAFVTEIWDIETKQLSKRICRALYDFNKEFTYGLSLNFARLQRLRPGYGYNSLNDETIGDKAPETDGIFYVNLKNNTSELLITLHDLAISADPELKYEHYVNHISISPDGERFMFFHIWNVSEGTGWRTRLYIYELSSKALTLLEDTDKVSHYDWHGNQEILVTCYRTDKSQYYAMYNVFTGEKRIVGNEILCLDGHPSFFHNETEFITDTYPLEHCKQYIYNFNMKEKMKQEIIALYSSPLMSGEKRCDLHPRLCENENMILCDSTYSENRRKIVLLKRRVEE